ncbi:MAG TPA: hypothetical protein VHR15_17800 [Ktedonobacterales bacterium]|jgi:hypothetical protein|nr:hypothetical protein [Ktedonobacterales bacterium]
MRHLLCARAVSCALLCVSLALCLALSGCAATQSDFTRQTASAGGEFAAAALTLAGAHQGRLTFAYARGSFVNYQSQLDGLDAQLPGLQGAPDEASVHHLLALYAPAMRAVEQPCLDTACDWRAQVNALNRASAAFLRAAETSA